MFKAFITILLSFLIILISNYFLSYIQTIRNLISFVCLLIVIALAIGYSFGIHYYPIFLLLIYVGAVVVATLFMVLTFDIRKEYKIKKRFIENRHVVFVVACFIDFVINAAALFISRADSASSAVADAKITVFDYQISFARCKASGADSDLCNTIVSVNNMNRSVYSTLYDSSHDLAVVSSNFYTTYAFLFISLTLFLTAALVAALCIIKQR